MDIKCTVCGVAKHYKPSAAAEVKPETYRCRKCFLAASGSRVVACRRCGKERKYDKTHFRKLDLELCRDCYNAERAEANVEVTCPRCQKVWSARPTDLKRRKDGPYCTGCPRVYDAEIPDTYAAGYVVGTILGDGFLYKRTQNGSVGYGLRLEVTSKVFADEFAKQLSVCCPDQTPWRGYRKVFGKGCPKIKMPAGESERHIVLIGSREWYEKLTPLKHGRNFSLIRLKGSEFRQGFVQGMIDSEGYVNPAYTDVANKDIALLAVVRDFLESMGHKAKIYGPYPYARGVAHLRVGKPLHKTE